MIDVMDNTDVLRQKTRKKRKKRERYKIRKKEINKERYWKKKKGNSKTHSKILMQEVYYD